MTGRDLQVLFGTALQDAGLQPVVKSRVAFDVLSRAREEIVGQLIASMGRGEVIRDNLRTLVKSQTLSVRVETGTGPIWTRPFTLPEDYRYFVRATALVEIDRAGIRDEPGERQARNAIVKVVEYDDLARLNEDPFNRTNEREIIATISDQDIITTATRTFQVVGMTITYLKNPAPLTRDSDVGLPDSVCRIIVDRAASLYRGDLARTASTPDAS